MAGIAGGGLAGVLADLSKAGKKRARHSRKAKASSKTQAKATLAGIIPLQASSLHSSDVSAVPSHLALGSKPRRCAADRRFWRFIRTCDTTFRPSHRRLLEHSSFDDLLSSLQRHVNSVTATSVATRKAALQQLHDTLFAGVPTAGAGSADDPYLTAAAEEDKAFCPSSITAASAVLPSAAAAATLAVEQSEAPAAGLPAFQTGDDSDDEESAPPAAPSEAKQGSDTGTTRSELLRGMLDVLLKPLLTRVDDPSEPCREYALAMLARLCRYVVDVQGFLRLVFPVLMERLPQTWSYDMQHNMFIQDSEAHAAFMRGRVVDDAEGLGVIEPSEECRALLCGVFSAIVDRCRAVGAIHLLDGFGHPLMLAVAVLLSDPFPDLRVEACSLLVALCNTLPHVVKVFAVGFAKISAQLLRHRYARVRLAGLDALQAAVAVPKPEKRKGAGTEAIAELVGFREENVVPIKAFYGKEVRHNYFASLAVDGNVLVRARFVRMLGEWLWSLPDRWDHESRLLPYLLSALGDSSVEISKAAFAWLENLGARYEQEKASDLLDERQLGIDGDARIDYDKPLPLPFSRGRPRVGLRLVVRNNCRRFFKPILADLGDWKGDTRRAAAGLLVTVLVFLEEMVTQDTVALLKVLCKTADDAEFGDLARTAARLSGRFVAPASYLPLILPLLQDGSTAAQVRRSSAPDAEVVGVLLRVLALLVSESRPSQVLPHVGAIVKALSSERVIQALSSDKRPASARVGLQPGSAPLAAADVHRLSHQEAAAAASDTQHPFPDTFGKYWEALTGSAEQLLPRFGRGHAAGSETEGLASLHMAQDDMLVPLALPASPYDAGVESQSVRCHFVACLAAVTSVLQGRLGAFAGAAFDATGRLGDGQTVANSMVQLWTLVLGLEARYSAGVPEHKRLLSRIAQTCVLSFVNSNDGAGHRIVVSGDGSALPTESTVSEERSGAFTCVAPLIKSRASALLSSALSTYPCGLAWRAGCPEHAVLTFVLQNLDEAATCCEAARVLDIAGRLVQEVAVPMAEREIATSTQRAARDAALSSALAEAAQLVSLCVPLLHERLSFDAALSMLDATPAPGHTCVWLSLPSTLAPWLKAAKLLLPAVQCSTVEDAGAVQVLSLFSGILSPAWQGAVSAECKASLCECIGDMLGSLPATEVELPAVEHSVGLLMHASVADASEEVAMHASQALATALANRPHLCKEHSAKAWLGSLLAALYEHNAVGSAESELAQCQLATAYAIVAVQPTALEAPTPGLAEEVVATGRTQEGHEDWIGVLQGHAAMLQHLAKGD